jgi:uncharacterized protein (TIGR02001 family)
MNKLKMALLAALALPTLNVVAEEKAEEAKSDFAVSYNIGLFSQYIFRGYTQTHGDPALQGGVDVEHSSGFYAGIWGSNVSWLDDSAAYDNGGSLEIDLYAGYASEIGDTGISYDVGVLQYLYPGEVSTGIANANTTEVHLGLGYGWFDTAVHVVTSDDAWTWGKVSSLGSPSAKGTAYYEINAEIPVGELIEHKFLSGVSGNLHFGYQDFRGKNAVYDNTADSYADWKVGLNKSFENGIDAGYYYTGTDVRNGEGWWIARDGKFLGDSAHTFYLTKSF